MVYKEGKNFSNHEQSKTKGTTQAGGSVACLGLDTLIKFGCEPIFLIGQDCALTGKRYYSKHTHFNQKLFPEIFGISQLDKLHKDKFYEKKSVEVMNTNGTSGITNQLMYSYLRNLEEIADRQKNTRIYNLCSQGAAIEGINSLNSISEIKRWLS